MTPDKVALDERLADVGWGVLLITIGVIGLLPAGQVPHGTWLIAAGLILLSLNAVRYFNGIRMRGFSLIVGILVLLAGLGEFFGLDLPLFAIALILIGGSCLFRRPLATDSTSPASQNCC
jgi:hypothetical protein